MRYIRGRVEDGRLRIKVGICASSADTSETLSLIYHEFIALIDTGARRTAISQNVIDRTQMTSRGKIPVGNVRRVEQHDTYLFYVGIWPENEDGTPAAIFGIGDPVMGIDGGDNRYYDVLLGMDIISRGSLHLELDGSFELAFPG